MKRFFKLIKDNLKDERGMELYQVIFIIALAAIVGGVVAKFVTSKTSTVIDYADQQFDFDTINSGDGGGE